ncbi:LTA synthase family protein [Bacillaceae bacterium S4-13-58]
MKSINRWIPLYILASLLFGLKTYIVYRFIFDLSIENPMQEMILFINPMASAFLIFGLGVWMKPKRQASFIRWTSMIGTVVIFANLLFYRNFNDFITIPVLFQSSNVGDLGGSILELFKITDIFLLFDVILVFWLTRKNHLSPMIVSYAKPRKTLVAALSLTLLIVNFVMAEIERPQLFTRAFDREYLVKNIGLFNYHIYDVVISSKTKAQRVFADGSEINDVENYVKENIPDDVNEELKGIAEGKNVIYISMESLQAFVINETHNGEEITPFLNDLISESFYFENFYHQTEQGKTSDSEFLVENSLYPLPRGAVFFTHGQNEYTSFPEILGEQGYATSVFHANNKSFWNRDVMYDALDFDHFFSEEYYQLTEENTIGWGLSDKAFFEQSIKYLETLPKPFYSRFITLTNHFPFDLPQEEANIDKYDSNSKTLNQYIQTARYTDDSLKEFFDLLKESGLYEESIIVLYGDHYGISEYHNKAMSQFLGKDEITPYDHIQLQRVPLFIHIPGYENNKVMTNIGGQIDIKPTIMNLLGLETGNDISFGSDLFAEERKPYIALRNGSFITNDSIYTESKCYDRLTGIENNGESCEPFKEQVSEELETSDQVIYGDLLRFFTKK